MPVTADPCLHPENPVPNSAGVRESDRGSEKLEEGRQGPEHGSPDCLDGDTGLKQQHRVEAGA